MRFDEVNMDNTIYGDVKFIIPTYVVETKKGEYHVSGTMCSIDTEPVSYTHLTLPTTSRV